MSVLDNCHLLCASGTVNSVSIRDGVELDRLWLPSLLHVHTHARHEPEKETMKTRIWLQTPAGSRLVQRNGGESMSWILLIFLLAGGCESCGRQTSPKCLRSSSGRRGCVRPSAPSAGKGGYYNDNNVK